MCVRSIVSFFTRIPVGSAELNEAVRCVWLLPLVELLVAFIVWLPFLAFQPLAAAALSYTLHVIVTGALHLDGLLDYMDAVLPGFRGTDALRVMKDPCRGVGGIVAAVTHSLVTVSMLYELAERVDAPRLAVLLAASYTIPAFYMLVSLALLPCEPYEGLARRFCTAIQASIGRLVALEAVITSLLIVYDKLVVAGMIGSLAAWLYLVRDVKARLGFVNGDSAGMIFEVTRAAFLVSMVIALRLASGL